MSAEAPSLTHRKRPLALASIIARSSGLGASRSRSSSSPTARSMAGEKMNKMKTTLKFLVEKGLQSGDALGLVAFDNTVDAAAAHGMDGAGREKALDAIAQLNVGGTTNLRAACSRAAICFSTSPRRALPRRARCCSSPTGWRTPASRTRRASAASA